MTKEGYLRKLAGNGLRWQQRYFRIVCSKLEYADSKSSKQWKTVHIGDPADICTLDRFGRFQLSTSARKMQLKAECMKEAANWVAALREASQAQHHGDGDGDDSFISEEEQQNDESSIVFSAKTWEEQEVIVHAHLDSIFEHSDGDFDKLLDSTDRALDDLEAFLAEVHRVPASAGLVSEVFYKRISKEFAFIDKIDISNVDKITTEQCIRPVAAMYRFDVLLGDFPEENSSFERDKSIESARTNKLMHFYITKIDDLVDNCCANLIARCEHEYRDFDNFCVKSLNGLHQTTLSIDLARMVQEYVEVAASAGDTIFCDKTIDLCVEKITQMQRTINEKLRQRAWDEENVSMEFYVAKINDYAECMVVVESLQEDYGDKNGKNARQFDELSHEFVNAAVCYMDRILDMMYNDLDDIISSKLFRDGWESGNAIATITCTFRDYFDELKQTTSKAFFNSIIKRSALRTVEVYVKAMISTYKEQSRKPGKYRFSEAGVMQVEKDYQALVDIFGCYVPHKYFIEDVQVLKDLYHFLRCSSDEVTMCFECVVRQNENCFLQVIDALRLCLKLRPNMSQSNRKSILVNCLALSKTYHQSLSPLVNVHSKSLYKILFPEAGVKHCTGVPWSLSSNSTSRLMRAMSMNDCTTERSPIKNIRILRDSSTPRGSFVKTAFFASKLQRNR